ncbi:uncharacterized protein [Clytia hemisphaerica]|uniref:Uncharacterized protein n=1 Tax=Clytia hemisphaerica TaxID=252671 RepID=A0A7M5VH52_9CNID
MVQARNDYNGLVQRKTAIASCVFGMLELLTAIIIVICAFVIFGGFCENLDCDSISKGIGLWLGFPLMIPSLLAVVVLGTRHYKSLLCFGASNLGVLILSIVHTAIVYNDDSDYWSKWVDAYNDGTKCAVNLASGRCECDIDGTRLSVPYACELISFGSDVNWILFGFSIVSIVLTLCGVIITLIGFCQMPPKPAKK